MQRYHSVTLHGSLITITARYPRNAPEIAYANSPGVLAARGYSRPIYNHPASTKPRSHTPNLGTSHPHNKRGIPPRYIFQTCSQKPSGRTGAEPLPFSSRALNLGSRHDSPTRSHTGSARRQQFTDKTSSG